VVGMVRIITAVLAGSAAASVVFDNPKEEV
jgi:hypothetical protein